MLAASLPEWYAKVCENEKYKCRVCSKDFYHDHYFEEGQNTHVAAFHWPFAEKERPDLSLETDNGIAVCKPCLSKIVQGMVQVPPKKEEVQTKAAKKISVKIPVESSTSEFQLHGDETICTKCKHFVAMAPGGVCMACEKRPEHTLKGDLAGKK